MYYGMEHEGAAVSNFFATSNGELHVRGLVPQQGRMKFVLTGREAEDFLDRARAVLGDEIQERFNMLERKKAEVNKFQTMYLDAMQDRDSLDIVHLKLLEARDE